MTANATLTVESIFSLLEDNLVGYEFRDQQIEFAQAVEQSIKSKRTGIFEAGTGTGKSLAALIPAILSGKKTVVSTATIALQEQYINKDIPFLKSILPINIDAALIKGRNNYLSLRRTKDYALEAEVNPYILQWLENTELGDRSELNFIPEPEQWREINSDPDDCLRNRCRHFTECFYFKARRSAEQANIIVVNHALLLIDAISDGNILPPYEVLIVDEAHHLPEIASKSFNASCSLRGLQILASKLARQVNASPYLIQNLNDATEFFQRLHSLLPPGKTRIKQPIPEANELLSVLHNIRDWLVSQTFENVLDIGEKRDKLKLKAKALTSTVNNYIKCLDLIESQDPDWVFWADKSDSVGYKMELVAAPLNTAGLIDTYIHNKSGLESSIWMSATLATGGEEPFAFFQQQIGSPTTTLQAQFKSPFDYTKQSVLYLPQNLPKPNNQEFIPAICQEIEMILHKSKGRAFVLFTSIAAMTQAYTTLSTQLPFECKQQGEMPRNKLIEWFKATANSVLFATASFWEGISIDGSALSCVIIDKIPFQSPDDPIYEAKCDRLKENGDNSWFNTLALPYAIMKLKQGVGRLIRTGSDKGIVAILDPRVTSQYYGRIILSCLPPMPVVRSLDEIKSIDEFF